jgi:hypothetical protein
MPKPSRKNCGKVTTDRTTALTTKPERRMEETDGEMEKKKEIVELADITPANAFGSCELLRERLTLARMLELSLRRSQEALRVLDLAAIERGTEEQMVWIRELGGCLCRNEPTPPAPTLSRGNPAEKPAAARQLEQELQQAAKRILDGIRLQLALLRRMRTKLRVLANMLAGTAVAYGPSFYDPSFNPSHIVHAIACHEPEGSDSCRA